MVTLIIPAAGAIPPDANCPAWAQRHPNGRCVLVECLLGLDLSNVTRVLIVLLREHVKKLFPSEMGDDEDKTNLRMLFDDVSLCSKLDFLLLEEPTHSGPDTVVEAITRFQITGPIFIKDCDGCFSHVVEKGNVVCVLRVTPHNQNTFNNLCTKSFVEHNGALLTNIVEKHIISDVVCVGGYGFECAERFVDKVKTLVVDNQQQQQQQRLFVSHVVYDMLLEGDAFLTKFVHNFHDWKTVQGWRAYCSRYRNMFVHLDGVLIHSNTSNPLPTSIDTWQPIASSVATLRRVYDENQTRIILTTERSSADRARVVTRLTELHIPFHDILFDMFHASQMLVNDFSNNHGMVYPTAVAVSVPTNCETLNAFLPSH